MVKQPAVYILANRKNGTLYTGVTSNLLKRVHEHKEEVTKGFSSKYKCKMLVFYEVHETMESAILREKQIKGGSRDRKIQLVQQINPEWKDLYAGLGL
ncbi:MAG TPA: GIY-YIG nuclease family protein [Alphaproteobacteria bacterium]|nr:GIY-YIG nuclease family protein [Micavibrio sp.]MBK9562366.1 GIY-YIG nuclease family protein [Micavibrio sp.]HQX26934.1 GIY-YIG nuclease family protein [Alphaproteobacteria bacterium]